MAQVGEVSIEMEYADVFIGVFPLRFNGDAGHGLVAAVAPDKIIGDKQGHERSFPRPLEHVDNVLFYGANVRPVDGTAEPFAVACAP
jgi:hypothetical protein